MHTLWNEGWQFVKLPLGSVYEEMKQARFTPVLLPHDWLIADTDALYESGDGWYVKSFSDADAAGETVLLHFDGVYMDADVLLNGKILRTHHYGYTPFFVDLTGKIQPGENEIAVHIRHQSPNSRWYSGAGIFRDVTLYRLPERHMIPDGFQVNTWRENGKWVLSVQAEIAGEGNEIPCLRLLDLRGRCIRETGMEAIEGGAAAEMRELDVEPWGPGAPRFYLLHVSLNGQEEWINVGFREVRFTPDQGLFINDQPVKLHGVCLHHDLGALGAAFTPAAADRQLDIMQQMGVNAIRTSHNPPAAQLLRMCDVRGILVMDELYDMWELPKTTYDNARFFPDTYPEDVAAWVRRDRTHPCVILWSIGNEIYDMQASDRGQYWTKTLMEEVQKHDTRHAPVTFASNYMPWEGAQKCADIVKLPGYNYAEKYYADHHAKHPDWVIYGSETGSLLYSRGIYHFPMGENILSDEDLQCSALMNSNTSWGANKLPKMLADDLNTPYSLGQFVWAGIDYIGEPTPYHTRNCYFGQTDTACFPKDAYYLYQAMWTDTPMIHIGIYWNWNKGQLIDVPVMTNGAVAELFLNGVSLGKKEVNRFDPEACLPAWQVPYEPGQLKAVAYDREGKILCEEIRESFDEPAHIRLKSSSLILSAGNPHGDLVFVTVTVTDAQGRPVENANNRVHVSVDAPGVLLGLDNGDSTDRDGYQTVSRRLFSGKLLIIVGANEGGTFTLHVTGKGLSNAEMELTAVDGNWEQRRAVPNLCREKETEDEVFVRQISLEALSSTRLTPDSPSVSFRVRALPENARPEALSFRVVNAQGVDMPCARLTQAGDTVTVTTQGDGSMYLRASACNGYPHPRILSQMEITAQDFGPMGLDPYGFIAGALADLKEGDIGAGNEQGIAFARESESAVGFSRVDFGPVGSDTLVLPIFALNGDLYRLKLWEGMPGAGGQLIAELPYQKPSIWNVYQEETYHLPCVLKGVHTLAFSLDCKAHMKGFSFVRQTRPLRYNRALDADQLYGDSFTKDEEGVKQIGNNVTLLFEHMEFARAGSLRLVLDGATDLDINTVSLRITGENGEAVSSTCDFTRSARTEQSFTVDVPAGQCSVAFVFLPGSRFDFYGFRFEEVML